MDQNTLGSIDGDALATIDGDTPVPTNRDILAPADKDALASADEDAPVSALKDKDRIVSVLKNRDILIPANWDVPTPANQDASALIDPDAPIIVGIADAFAKVFCLVLCLFAFAFFLLIYSISKLSRGGFYMLPKRRTCLSSPINCLFFSLILPSRSSTNQRGLSSKYPKLVICITSPSRILSAIEVTGHWSEFSSKN